MHSLFAKPSCNDLARSIHPIAPTSRFGSVGRQDSFDNTHNHSKSIVETKITMLSFLLYERTNQEQQRQQRPRGAARQRKNKPHGRHATESLIPTVSETERATTESTTDHLDAHSKQELPVSLVSNKNIIITSSSHCCNAPPQPTLNYLASQDQCLCSHKQLLIEISKHYHPNPRRITTAAITSWSIGPVPIVVFLPCNVARTWMSWQHATRTAWPLSMRSFIRARFTNFKNVWARPSSVKTFSAVTPFEAYTQTS